MATEQFTKKNFRGENLTGRVFGRLTVYRLNPTLKFTSWICFCECGNVMSAYASHLRRGNTVSCGCHRNEQTGIRFRTHGKSKNVEYRTWQHMLKRCVPGAGHKDYGGRGIRVCERWSGKNGFQNFLVDMGERPKLPGRISIDRIDNDGNYEPGNCRWATQKEQMLNKRSNHWIEFRGQRKTITQWAKERGIAWGTLGKWIGKYGLEAAMTAPILSLKGKRRRLAIG